MRVDVGAVGGGRAEFEGGDGEDAGAAAVVEHGFAAFDVAVEPLQAQAGGGVAAGAEGEAGVEAQAEGGGVGRVVPGGGDPQAVGDFDGVELRLGEAHPVLFGHVFAAVFGNGDAEGCGSGGEAGGRVGIFGKQSDDFAVLPNLFGAHAGFAE